MPKAEGVVDQPHPGGRDLVIAGAGEGAGQGGAEYIAGAGDEGKTGGVDGAGKVFFVCSGAGGGEAVKLQAANTLPVLVVFLDGSGYCRPGANVLGVQRFGIG